MKNLSDYSQFSITELIDKIANSRYWNLPKMTAEALKKLNNKTPYKVYTALLSQDGGTSDPIANVLQNTLGVNVVWTRVGEGVYKVFAKGVFTKDKTTFSYNMLPIESSTGKAVEISDSYRADEDQFMINVSDGETIMDGFIDIMIEIRVYN